MYERGLMDYWGQMYRRIPPQCLANTKGARQKKEPDNNKSRLSLKNLTGAFIVLLVGYALALLAYIFERIAHEMANKSKKKRQTSIISL